MRASQDPLAVLAQLTFGDMVSIAEANQTEGTNGVALAASRALMTHTDQNIRAGDVLEALTTLGILCVMSRPQTVVQP